MRKCLTRALKCCNFVRFRAYMKNPQRIKISTFGSQITSAISVAMVLLLIGLMAMALVTSHKLADDIRSNVGVVVKMLPSSVTAENQRVERLILAQPGIASVRYSSPDEILAEESEMMGEDISAMLDQNPFGGEFEVRILPEYVYSDSIAKITAIIQEDPSVDEIVTETEVVDSINSVLGRVTAIMLVVAIAMLIISFVLINNTVSIAVYSRRFIIHTMKLVGATGAFIRRPFLIAGLITGLVSGVLAIGIVAAIRAYSATFDHTVDDLLGWGTMTLIFAGMLVIGPAICVAASSIATNRYLRADYDDMFKS